MKEKSKKPEVVRNTTAPDKRAKGVKLPGGNPTLVARKTDTAKLPPNLLALYQKIEGKGKEGMKLSALCPQSSAGRYTRWLLRQLVKLEALEAVAEPKPEPKPPKGAPKTKSAMTDAQAKSVAKGA